MSNVVSQAVLERAAAQPRRKNMFWLLASTLCEAANLNPDLISVALVQALVPVPKQQRRRLKENVQVSIVRDIDHLTALVDDFVATCEQ